MYIYLHGFASSPQSTKAVDLKNYFTSIQLDLQTPDLNAGDFSHLTISRQIKQVTSLFSNEPVTLIGSSLGGLTSAHIAQKYKHVEKLVLLAPAFGFLTHWLPKLGDEKIKLWQEEKYLSVYHYGEKQELPLHYNFVTDASLYFESDLQRPIPTLILHGKDDEIIPIQASRDFAQNRPWVELIELDSDHALGNSLLNIWQAIKLFCNLP